MNCKVESVTENRRNNVDTLPPKGRVKEVRREWLVHEDGALAYRLQDEEIRQHLTGNKSRNLQIREDFPTAKNEQEREALEAAKVHQELLYQQEQQDARVAAQLADKIEREEAEKRRALEEEDKELAKLLYEREQSHFEKRERDQSRLECHTPRKGRYQSNKHKRGSYDGDSPDHATLTDVSHTLSKVCASSNNNEFYDSNLSDINKVGLPLQDEIVTNLRSCNIRSYSSYNDRHTPSPVPMSEEEARRLQEEKDEELARFLQEKENLENLDTVNRDRLLAIETQDKELARLLQEKERAKAKRAKERAKQKAALKKLQENGSEEQESVKGVETASIKSIHQVDEGAHRSTCPPVPGLQSPRNKPRYPDPEEIVELPLEASSSSLANIAMTIDPTYGKETSERQSRHKKVPIKYEASEDSDKISLAGVSSTATEPTEDLNAPPYMPIQGHRRVFEKKTRPKDGCKQQ